MTQLSDDQLSDDQLSDDQISDERLSETFAALANPTRRAILARLSEGEASVNELAAPFAMTLPAVSRHIKVLERAGLVSQGQRAQYRPCTLDARPLEGVATWAERYRPVWEERFDRLDDYVRRLRHADDDHDPDHPDHEQPDPDLEQPDHEQKDSTTDD